MARTVTVTSDPRPVPAKRERRCREVRIIFEKGNPNVTVIGLMERWLLDASGKTLGLPDHDGAPLVRRDLTPAMLAANPTAANILTSIINAMDTWDIEDGNAV